MIVVNKRSTRKFTVYIGRGSIFGNPFKIGEHGTREEVIEKYREYAKEREPLLAAIYKLDKDDILGCYCKPYPCHGDVIIELWEYLHEEAA